MFSIVLYQPEIPPNTGNIIRLSANLGAELHLIRPLGFELSDRTLRRAGLDYHEYARMRCHDSWQACALELGKRRVFACTTKAGQHYHLPTYQADDVFLFGCETRGLPAEILDDFAQEQKIRIPMQPGQRSLNLANAVAIVCFEAWRQRAFHGSV